MRLLGLAGVSKQPNKKPGPKQQEVVCSLSDPCAESWVSVLRSNFPGLRMAFLNICRSIIFRVVYGHGTSVLRRVVATIIASLFIWEAHRIGRKDLDTGNNCYISDRVFTNTVKRVAYDLRVYLESNGGPTKNQQLEQQVEWLLRVDIELRATSTVHYSGVPSEGTEESAAQSPGHMARISTDKAAEWCMQQNPTALIPYWGEV